MNLTMFQILWSRKDVRIIVIGTAVGGVLQIISLQYLKKHPELLEENNEKPRSLGLGPRGGALI